MCALQVGAGMTWSVYAHRPGDSIASMTRKLASKTRMVFDYLLTRNKRRAAPSVSDPHGGRTTYVVGLGALMTKNSTGHVPAA